MIEILQTYSHEKSKNTVNHLLKVINEDDLATRLNKVSQYFLNYPYFLGALGEGSQGYFDQSPVFRTDVFDCVTYVNTVLAIALAKDFEQFENNLRKINYYEGELDFLKRFHFTCCDWNLMNAKNGILQDITIAISKNRYNWSEVCIDKPNWFKNRQVSDIKLLQTLSNEALKRKLKELHQLADLTIPVISRIPYISLDDLFDEAGSPEMTIFNQIPTGSIVEIIRPNWDLRAKIGTHLNLSHLGFVFWEEKTCLFRHASSEGKKVVDQSLVSYLKSYRNHNTIKGINVQWICR